MLHYTLEKGNCELTRYLIKKGANYNVINNKGESPADIAVEKGYEVVLELMTDIKVHTSIGDDTMEFDDVDSCIYRPDYGAYDNEFDMDEEDEVTYDDDEYAKEQSAIQRYDIKLKIYSDMYGAEKGKMLADLYTRMEEMILNNTIQDNIEEYTQITSEIQALLIP